ncbi:MAG: response regulator [Burkholderiales bacterium]|nr:response regulator [Burkholderiales bacterium]
MRATLLACCVVLALVLAPVAQARTAPGVQAGTLDLTGWDFTRDGIVALDGQWQFAPGQLLAPSDPWPADAKPVEVPGAWNTVLGHGHGYGTYRLHVRCQGDPLLGLAVPVQHSAARYLVNGRPVLQVGEPGAAADAHQPVAKVALAALPTGSCPMTLLVQVSNFEAVRGGLFRSIQLGSFEQVSQRREHSLLRSQLALGAMLFLGLFTLMFVPMRRRDWGGGLFAVFTFSYTISLGLMAERPLQPLVEGIGFEGQMRIVFTNWAIGPVALPLMLARLYPAHAGWPRLAPALASFSAVLAVLPLVTPARIFMQALPLVVAAGLLMAFFAAYVLARASFARAEGAALLLGGLVVMIATGWHDSLGAQHLLDSSWLPYGMLGFEAALALMLAQRFARALASEELRAVEQSERTGMLVRATQAGLADWDVVHRKLTLSDRYKEMFGYAADTADAAVPDYRDMLHPDDRDEVYGLFARQLRARDVRNGVRQFEPRDYRMQRADGEYVWVHAEAIGICGPDGRVLRVVSSFIDVTASKRHEQEMAGRLKFIGDLFDSVPIALVLRDPAGRYLFVNRAWERYMGLGRDSVLGTSLRDVADPAAAEALALDARALALGPGASPPPHEYDYNGRRLIQTRTVMADATGAAIGVLVASLDITEKQQVEEALRRSRDQVAAQAKQLEAQNEALKENVRLREEVERIGRHDLKTPLNSIVAVPRLLREERQLGPEADELLGIVERAGYRILSMVNLSLDLYKMEQGTYVFRPDAVDLAELALKVVAEVRMHAASKQVLVQLKAHSPPYAWAEELLCYSLIANLLKNAVEASPEGGVVDMVIAAAEEGTVQVRIHNSGAVPEAIRASFFRKYTTMGKASGTGLGSYSAWLMAKVQDGRTEMTTSDQGGTTLSVTLRTAPPGKLPAAARHAAEKPDPHAKEIASLPPTRVLLVDDDEYNLMIVRRFLPTPPFTVDTAINGRVALGAAELQWPDLVLMDLDMPVMGGLQAVVKLREMQRATLAGACTIVALSSHDDEETQRAALASGFDQYLTKPVTREAIHSLLRDLHLLIGVAPTPMPAPMPIRTRAPEPGDPIRVDPDYEPIMDDFIASRRALLAQLELAARGDDRSEIRRIAHQLAGSFALYGFGWASERSHWLEKNFTEVPPGGVERWATDLRRHLDTVQIRFDRQEA